MPIFNPAIKRDIINDKLSDTDLDTKIEVEKNADEDIIRHTVAGVESHKINNDGIIDMAKQSSMRAYRKTSYQSIPNRTSTKVEFNEIDDDEQREFDEITHHRFTARKKGIYLCISHILFVNWVSGSFLKIMIYKNGINISDFRKYPITNTFPAISITDRIKLEANDYLEIFVVQETGSSKSIYYKSPHTNFAVHKLS